jgi:tetratricopeptide (TPR) repeat protein
MVGNEEAVIERMLNSCYKYIDYYVVQCNGNDSTEKIINDFFEEKGIPGFTYQIEWNYPGWNRDHALQKCLEADHGCDWILRMDADEQLKIEDTFDWSQLDDTSIQSFNIVSESPGSIYHRTWMWNANFPWTFRHDKRHECILLNGGEDFQRVNLSGDFKQIVTNDGETWVNPTKFLTDALELENHHISKGTLLSDTYHFFYVGKSYNDCYSNPQLPLGYEHQKEYARRCIFYLQSFVDYVNRQDEVVYYAQYLVGNAYKFCGEFDKAIEAYNNAQKYCYERNEHFCGLAETYWCLGDYQTMLEYTSILMSPDRKNPFPNCAFLIHTSAYHNTGEYVQYLHDVACSNV